MSITQEDWTIEICDNPIIALCHCFKQCNLPHQNISDHCVALQVQGDWHDYDVHFEHQAQQECFIIKAQLPLSIQPDQFDSVYGLIGRLNNDRCIGHFRLDTKNQAIYFHHSISEAFFPALDFNIIEDIIENAVESLETLYPIAHSLLHGSSNVNEALHKYLHSIEGNA